MPGPTYEPMPTFALLDWRRRVAELYREIRTAADPATAHETWSAVRNELFATHSQTPLPEATRRAFAGLPVAPYDPELRFVVEVDTDVERLQVAIMTSAESALPCERAGVVHLPGIGDLDVWWISIYGGGVFLPLKDGLGGVRTYGGGRYLLDTIKGADLGGDDGHLVVDLNFAYNPSCAYDPKWTCPLAPSGNIVAAEVFAGELVPPSLAGYSG